MLNKKRKKNCKFVEIGSNKSTCKQVTRKIVVAMGVGTRAGAGAGEGEGAREGE